MARTVALPRNLSQNLDRLAHVDSESNGFLLYKLYDDICLVDSMTITGVGDEGHVNVREDLTDTLFNYVIRHGYDPRHIVRFHTHTRGTIRKFGQHFARNFSKQDIDYYQKLLQEHPSFIAMVVTPETKLLYGLDSPELVVTDEYKGQRLKLHSATRSD